MNCKKCGALLNETDAFCKNCGSLVGFDTAAIDGNSAAPIIPKIENGIIETPKLEEKVTDKKIPVPTEIKPIFPISENKESTLDQPKEITMEKSKEEILTSSPLPLEETASSEKVEEKLVEEKVISKKEKKEKKVKEPIFDKNAPFLEEEEELEIDEIKKSKKGFIIIAVIVAIIVFCAIFFVVKYINDKKSDSEVDKPNITAVEKYRINFGGYVFEIPESYIYQVAGNKLYVSDGQNTWTSAIQMANIDYDTINTNKDQILATYKKNGFAISNVDEKEIGKRKYYAIELQSSEKYALAVYSKAMANHVFAFTAYNPTYTIDYAILENISTILDSATYMGATGTITQTSSIDVLNPLK